MFLTGEVLEEPLFPGSKIYSLILAYIRLASQFGAIYNSPARNTWLNSWQLDQGFLNPLQVKATIVELQKIATAFRALADALDKELPDLLHTFTANEWIGTNIAPKVKKIDDLVEKVVEKLPCMQASP